MRLLNTDSFELKEFIGDKLPPYAILSHTWGDDEIVFEDVQKGNDAWKSKSSFKKVAGFRALAKESGYKWCWIDTLCIDKSSSAELSEAINSMFCWYARSHVCFAYLVDVQIDHAEPEKLRRFERSRWHRRGWTLQELLAPERVEFYDANWNQFGTRLILRDTISKITGIRAEILLKKFDVEASQDNYCVAEKMSWAANRYTSRVEDMSYCLLGIFDVHMPLLYGEGNRAFERLQLQILAQTEDLTLLAWKGKIHRVHAGEEDRTLHLLANSPSDFYESTTKHMSGSRLWTYRSLQAGPYDKVLHELRMMASGKDSPYSIQSQGFVHEQPVKRLDTVVLSIAYLPGSNKFPYDEIPSYVILNKLRRSANSPVWGYLCVRVEPYSYSYSVYIKAGPPVVVSLEDRSGVIHFTRASILLKPENVLDHRTSPPEPSALVVLSVQGDNSEPRQAFSEPRLSFMHSGDLCTVLLFQHGATEFLVLHGFKGNEKLPAGWIVITTWKELRATHASLPISHAHAIEPHEESVEDFARQRLESGVHVYCTIRPRSYEWYDSQKRIINVPNDVPRPSLVGSYSSYFSLDVCARCCKGRIESVTFLKCRTFRDDRMLLNWLHSGNARELFSNGTSDQVRSQSDKSDDGAYNEVHSAGNSGLSS